MIRKIWQHLLLFDWWLFISVFLLVVFSLVMLGSIEFNSQTLAQGSFVKQILYFVIGSIAMFSISFIDYRWLRNYSYVFFILSVLLLTAVLIFGVTVRGTTGWFQIGSASFQPVELVKIFLILFLAYYFSAKSGELRKFKNILTSAFSVGLILFLIILQPDLGSALITLFIWLGLLFLINTKKRYLVLIIGTLILVALSSWFLVFKDYQKERILTFVDPSRDPLGTGYNLSQSLVAVGSGKLWGRGLGLGTQSQLNFLPEQENDFIFASLAEELGFIGAGSIIFLFGFIFFRIFKTIRHSPDDFAFFVSSGILLLFFGQTSINIGMNLGVMPITGLPLPFVSAGGSSLITSLMAIGIIQSINFREKRN